MYITIYYRLSYSAMGIWLPVTDDLDLCSCSQNREGRKCGAVLCHYEGGMEICQEQVIIEISGIKL